MIQIEKIKAEIERRIAEKEKELEHYTDEDYVCSSASSKACKLNAYIDLLSFIESLEKEQPLTKRNKLFDECVENCDTATMKEVSDNVDKLLEKEQPQGLGKLEKEKAQEEIQRHKQIQGSRPFTSCSGDKDINNKPKIQGLDEAAEKAGWEWACENNLDPYSMGQAYSEGHKAGAKWMAEQGETYEGGIWRNWEGKLIAKAELKADSMFKYSEDVIIQVRKKED